MEVTSEHSIHELHFVVSTYQVYFFFNFIILAQST